MSVHFRCTSCEKELTASSGAAGNRILCPRCGASVAVPGATTGPVDGARSIAVKMRFVCPKCSGSMEIDAREAGSQMLCSRCHASIKAPDSLLGPGAFLGGYQILQPLDSRNSSGDTFLAKVPGAEDKVVLKVLRLDISSPKEIRARFLKEIRDAARLQHPNIVAVHEAGEEGGMLFAATEYVDGDSLNTLVREGHPLPEQQALAIAKQVVYALACAWEKQRLVHLDLQPSKLLLDRRGRLKVAGLGWPNEDPMATGRASPVTNFMSPEILEGRVLGGSHLNELSGRPAPDCRSDMYSLGLLLYHMVTGTVPFKGKTILDTLQSQVGKPLPDPREFQPGLSDSCLALLERLLTRKLTRRHVNWTELLTDLERAQQDALGNLPPLPTGESAIVRGKVPAANAAAARKRPAANATGTHREGAAARAAHSQTLTMAMAHRRPEGADSSLAKVVTIVIVCLIVAALIATFAVLKRQHDREARQRVLMEQEQRDRRAWGTPAPDDTVPTNRRFDPTPTPKRERRAPPTPAPKPDTPALNSL